ncbi:hypothetical protein B7L09_26125 [Pseudomonas mandelii]|nr:hypothetical protein B7L09_26125 [Pseudomonas mandelii]
MGAGLLAKAVCQSTSMLNDTPLSRASPLPQGCCGVAESAYKKGDLIGSPFSLGSGITDRYRSDQRLHHH